MKVVKVVVALVCSSPGEPEGQVILVEGAGQTWEAVRMMEEQIWGFVRMVGVGRWGEGAYWAEEEAYLEAEGELGHSLVADGSRVVEVLLPQVVVYWAVAEREAGEGACPLQRVTESAVRTSEQWRCLCSELVEVWVTSSPVEAQLQLSSRLQLHEALLPEVLPLSLERPPV